jgi:glycosyltransferase involved in cell wall biosynthesis
VEERASVRDSNLIHVVTVGRNYAEFAERNLRGLLGQTVTNWRCTWVDDASTDGSADKVEALRDERVTLIRNAERVGAFRNRDKAIELAHADDIVVFWDADDFYENPRVFERILREYQDPDCWLTYGGARCWPSGISWDCDYEDQVHRDRSYRTKRLHASHAQTFRAWLYRRIDEHDKLDDDGLPWRFSTDSAVMIPLMEMAGREHSRHITDPLYLYNCAHPGTCVNTDNAEVYDAIKRLRLRPKKPPCLSPSL